MYLIIGKNSGVARGEAARRGRLPISSSTKSIPTKGIISLTTIRRLAKKESKKTR